MGEINFRTPPYVTGYIFSRQNQVFGTSELKYKRLWQSALVQFECHPPCSPTKRPLSLFRYAFLTFAHVERLLFHVFTFSLSCLSIKVLNSQLLLFLNTHYFCLISISLISTTQCIKTLSYKIQFIA